MKKSPELLETEEMLKEWSERSNIDYRQAKMLWEILKETMLRHTAVKFRSMDFGFFVLHVCPYRSNWKNYFLQRFPWIGSWIRRYPSAERREAIFRESEFNLEMFQTDKLAVRNGLVYLGLEVVPRRRWWYYMLHVQRKIASSMGPAKYCQALARLVSGLGDRLKNAYVSHLSQIAIPCGRLASGRYFSGRQYLVENRGRGKIRPRPDPVRLGPLFHPFKPDEFSQPCGEEDQITEASTVLSVPDHEPKIVDVRDRGKQRPPSRD